MIETIIAGLIATAVLQTIMATVGGLIVKILMMLVVYVTNDIFKNLFIEGGFVTYNGLLKYIGNLVGLDKIGETMWIITIFIIVINVIYSGFNLFLSSVNRTDDSPEQFFKRFLIVVISCLLYTQVFSWVIQILNAIATAEIFDIGKIADVRATIENIKYDSTLNGIIDLILTGAFIIMLVQGVISAAITFIERYLSFSVYLFMGLPCIALGINKDTQDTAKRWFIGIVSQMICIMLSIFVINLYFRQFNLLVGTAELAKSEVELHEAIGGNFISQLLVCCALLTIVAKSEQLVNMLGLNTMINGNTARNFMYSAGLATLGVGKALAGLASSTPVSNMSDGVKTGLNEGWGTHLQLNNERGRNFNNIRSLANDNCVSTNNVFKDPISVATESAERIGKKEAFENGSVGYETRRKLEQIAMNNEGFSARDAEKISKQGADNVTELAKNTMSEINEGRSTYSLASDGENRALRIENPSNISNNAIITSGCFSPKQGIKPAKGEVKEIFSKETESPILDAGVIKDENGNDTKYSYQTVAYQATRTDDTGEHVGFVVQKQKMLNDEVVGVCDLQPQEVVSFANKVNENPENFQTYNEDGNNFVDFTTKCDTNNITYGENGTAFIETTPIVNEVATVDNKTFVEVGASNYNSETGRIENSYDYYQVEKTNNFTSNGTPNETQYTNVIKIPKERFDSRQETVDKLKDNPHYDDLR